MVQCEPPIRKIKPNSLAKDKELTDTVKNMSRRFRLRMEDIKRKADDLEIAAKGAKDRVICSESKLVNLKNYKTVNQLISTENIPKKEKIKPRGDGELVMTHEILDHHIAHLKELSKTYVPYNTPPVFVTPNINDYKNGVYANGHASNGVTSNGHTANGYNHIPIINSSQNDLEDEYESDESTEVPVQNGTSQSIPPAPVIPVHPFRHRDSPSPSLEPTLIPTKDSDHIENHAEPSTEPPIAQNILEVQVDQEPSAPPPPMQRVQTRPPALVSVIDEMKAKVAAQPRYKDSDSDPDTEPLSGSQTKPSTSSEQVESHNEKKTVPAARQEAKTSDSTSRIEQPPPLQPPAKRSEQKEKSNKMIDNIFDSDSDTEPVAQSSSQKPTHRNNVAQIPSSKPSESAVAHRQKPSKSPQLPPAQPKMPRKAVQDKEKECKVVDNIFDSDSEPEPPKPSKPVEKETEKPKKIYFLNLPPKEERGPWKIPPKVAAAKAAKEAAAKEAAAKEEAAKEAAARRIIERKTNSKQSAPTKVGKSLFSSDSDSDDEFLKSFSKKKPSLVTMAPKAEASKTVAPKTVDPVKLPPKTVAPVKMAHEETTIAKSEPAIVEKPESIPVPRVVNPPAAAAHVSTASTTSTTVTVKEEVVKETKPEPKIETKKPKSLFDDSDSDSDLFSTSNKPKLLNTSKEPSPAVDAPPKMEPPHVSSEQTEPTRTAKKEPTSEKMSAKISLIADLQKTFRLPGTPPPKIAVKDDKEDTSSAEEAGTATILKSRVRGPPNRRPPTRPNLSK